MIAYELELRCVWPGFRACARSAGITPTLTQFFSPFVAGRMYGLGIDQMVAAAGISGSSHFTLAESSPVT